MHNSSSTSADEGKGVRALIVPVVMLALFVFPPTRHLIVSVTVSVGHWFGHLFAKSVVHSIPNPAHPTTTG